MFDGVRITNEPIDHSVGIIHLRTLLSRTELAKRLNRIQLRNNALPHIENSDVAFGYISLLCQGKRRL